MPRPLRPRRSLITRADGFAISGGTIRSATFFAAETGTPISMEIALKGVQLELHKIGGLVIE